MVRYVVRRGLASLLVLAGVSVLIFTLVTVSYTHLTLPTKRIV